MGLDIQVVIDGGSSNDFLQPQTVKFLKLLIQSSPLLKVMVDNGITWQLTERSRIFNWQYRSTPSIFLCTYYQSQMLISFWEVFGLQPLASIWLTTNHCKSNSTTKANLLPYKGWVEVQLNHICNLHHMDAIVEIFTLQITNMVESPITIFEVPKNIALHLVLFSIGPYNLLGLFRGWR